MVLKTEEDVANWVKHNFSEKEFQGFKKFPIDSPEVPCALVAYKGNLYKNINTYLRKNPSGIETNEKLGELQKYILKNSIPTDITVFRYVSFEEVVWLAAKTQWGTTCSYNGFLSTTLLQERYRELHSEVHRRVVIEIQVPKGAKGIYLPELNPAMPEFEVLFPHGTRLKYNGPNKYKILTE